MAPALEFKINLPDPERAQNLALQAFNDGKEGNFQSAIVHIEEAITLEWTAALDVFQSLRAEAYASLGQESVKKSIKTYNYAKSLGDAARYRDAALAYQEAAVLDPMFLWPLNNLAWMLSTAKEPSVRNGPEAIKYAQDVCERSNWNCWAFIGTLAAAYAEAGDFRRAVGWQKASLPLVPEDHRLDAELMLRRFELSQAHIDEGMRSAAGGESSAEDVALNTSRLLRPEQVSQESLQDLFQANFLEVEFGSDETLWISGDVRVMVQFSEGGELISLITLAKRSRHANIDSCRQFANRVNASHPGFVRTAYHENEDVFAFDYLVPVGEGIAKQAVVSVVSSFMSSVVTIINERDTGKVVERS